MTEKIIYIKDNAINITLAISFKDRLLGLMFKDLKRVKGMLFVFNKPSHQIMWNLFLRSPIYVIWIRGNKIIGYSKLNNFRYFPQIVISPYAVDQVLELDASLIKEEDIFNLRV